MGEVKKVFNQEKSLLKSKKIFFFSKNLRFSASVSFFDLIDCLLCVCGEGGKKIIESKKRKRERERKNR